MLFALLFDEHHQLLAAAPACDQQPHGQRFWSNYYPQQIEIVSDTETAYLEIDDPIVQGKLIEFQTDDRLQADCQTAVDRMVSDHWVSDFRSPKAA